MRRMALRRTFLGAAVPLFCVGCVESGQTGSPLDDPPSYSGPNGFTPGTDGGVPSHGAEDPGARPGMSDDGNDVSGFSDGHLVVAGHEVLRIFDVSGESPVLLSESPLRGFVKQIEVLDGFAWVALQERSFFDGDEIPTEEQRDLQHRLIAIDLSDPSKPERVDQIDIEGGFWKFERRDNDFFVVAEEWNQLDLGCGENVALTEGPGTAAMRVDHIRYTDAEFEKLESERVETQSLYTFLDGDSFFIGQGGNTGPQDFLELSFSSGSLERAEEYTLGQSPSAIARDEGATFIATRDGDLVSFVDGSASSVASVNVGDEVLEIHLVEPGLLLVQGPQAASWWDVSDPGSPRLVEEIASNPVSIALVGGRTVVLESRGTELAIQLWDTADPAAPTRLDELMISEEYELIETYSARFEAGAVRNWTWEEDHLWVPVGNSSGHRVLGVSLGGDALTVAHDIAAENRLLRPRANSSFIFDPRGEALRSRLLQDGASWVTGETDPDEPQVTVTIEETQFTLERDAESGFPVVRSGEDAVELPHHVDSLLAVQGSLVAIGLATDGECEEWERLAMEGVEAEELGEFGDFQGCGPANARGFSVIDPDTLTIVETFLLPSYPGGGSDERSSWDGYFFLPDGRFALPEQHWEFCHSKSACEELGAKAYKSASSGGCSSEGGCDESVSESWGGSLESLRIHVLDGVEASELSFEEKVEVEGNFSFFYDERSADLSELLFVQGDRFAFSRTEDVYSEIGETAVDENDRAITRSYLTIFSIVDGDIELDSDINTPGVPVYWSGDELLSVEPRFYSAQRIGTTLHHSELRNGGAFIVESEEIAASFRGSRATSDWSYLLFGPEDVCAAEGDDQLIPATINASGMQPGTPHLLPGDWRLPYNTSALAGDRLTLRGGPVAQASGTWDISGGDELELVSYVTPDEPWY